MPKKKSKPKKPEPPRDNEDPYAGLDPERRAEVLADNAFLSSPVTVWALIEVVAHAVAEIKGLKGDDAVAYSSILERDVLNSRARTEWDKIFRQK
jgi:hypothetical protein